MLTCGQVVEWVLAPVRARWQAPAWQAALGSPAAFMAAYMPLAATGAGFAEARVCVWELLLLWRSMATCPRHPLLNSRASCTCEL